MEHKEDCPHKVVRFCGCVHEALAERDALKAELEKSDWAKVVLNKKHRQAIWMDYPATLNCFVKAIRGLLSKENK